MSGFCTNESFFNGLNNPVDLKFCSITLEISSPNLSVSNNDNFSDFESTCNGEIAIGNGSRLPLVISTLIRLYAFLKLIIKNKKIKNIFFIIFSNLLTFLLDQNLAVNSSIFHIRLVELLMADRF